MAALKYLYKINWFSLIMYTITSKFVSVTHGFEVHGTQTRIKTLTNEKRALKCCIIFDLINLNLNKYIDINYFKF